jgi:hypothetical protein
MDDKPRYWFGAKIGFFRYRPPLGWRGWVAVAVWMTVWLAAPGHLSVLIVDTAGVEKIINSLGELRAAMTPEVPHDCPTGQMVRALFDPRWSTELEMMQGNSVLHLRDHRYGWLHYMIPKPEAKKLAGFLTLQADTPAPSPEPGKGN